MDGFEVRKDRCRLSLAIHCSCSVVRRGIEDLLIEQVCEWASARNLTRIAVA